MHQCLFFPKRHKLIILNCYKSRSILVFSEWIGQVHAVKMIEHRLDLGLIDVFAI